YSIHIYHCFPSTTCSLFFFLIILRPPFSTLFPYTTLFRSLCPQLLQICQSLKGNDIFRIDLCKVSIDTAGLLILAYRLVGEYERSEEHTSELQSRENLVCRLLLEKKKKKKKKSKINK